MLKRRAVRPMTVRESIEFDVLALKRYFQRLFVLIRELSDATAEPAGEMYVGDPTAFVRRTWPATSIALSTFG